MHDQRDDAAAAGNPYATHADDPFASVHPEADSETRQWAMILHLSQFAGYIVPMAGFLAPILIWQIKKDELPGIDEHGRAVVNWIISGMIYVVVCLLLCLVLIGVPLLAILGVLSVVFPIIGAIKAADGKLWTYPMTIKFL